MVKNKKMELVPASGGLSNFALAVPAMSAALPKNVKKLTLPPMVKPEQIAVGSMVSGTIVALVGSISEKVKEGKLVHLRHDTGTEFLLPLTGTIKRAIGGFDGVTANIGKKLFVVRQADGETLKYNAKGDTQPRKVFMFDVYLAD
jgi:hypothetical protein